MATGTAQYVEDSVDVGARAVGSLAYNSREDVLYGASEEGTFFAISCDSNKVVESFYLQYAFRVAYDSVDNRAYCTFGDSLLVVDGVTHSRIKALPMEVATNPVWDLVSNRVYVSCQTTNRVAVVDCVTDSVLMYIPVGACPIKMYINTLRRKLYVLNYDDGTVSIVNMTTNQVIRTVATESGNAGYYCSWADKFYCDGPRDTCVVIGGQCDTVVARISLSGLGSVLSATGNEDAGLVYLGVYTGSADRVVTVSVQNDSVLAAVVIGREPWGMQLYVPSGLLYCTSARTDEVCVLTGDGAGIRTTLSVGDCPYVFAAAPRHDRLYVGHLNGRYVYVLRDTSAGLAESQPPGSAYQGARATPNPFSQRVALAWNAPAGGNDVACVYAPDGGLIKQAQIAMGASRWVWDGRDSRGRPASPGVYVLAAPGGLRAKAIKLR